MGKKDESGGWVGATGTRPIAFVNSSILASSLSLEPVKCSAFGVTLTLCQFWEEGSWGSFEFVSQNLICWKFGHCDDFGRGSFKRWGLLRSAYTWPCPLKDSWTPDLWILVLNVISSSHTDCSSCDVIYHDSCSSPELRWLPCPWTSSYFLIVMADGLTHLPSPVHLVDKNFILTAAVMS